MNSVAQGAISASPTKTPALHPAMAAGDAWPCPAPWPGSASPLATNRIFDKPHRPGSEALPGYPITRRTAPLGRKPEVNVTNVRRPDAILRRHRRHPRMLGLHASHGPGTGVDSPAGERRGGEVCASRPSARVGTWRPSRPTLRNGRLVQPRPARAESVWGTHRPLLGVPHLGVPRPGRRDVHRWLPVRAGKAPHVYRPLIRAVLKDPTEVGEDVGALDDRVQDGSRHHCRHGVQTDPRRPAKFPSPSSTSRISPMPRSR